MIENLIMKSDSPTPPNSGGWGPCRCPSQAQGACPERTPSAAEGEVEGLREAHPLSQACHVIIDSFTPILGR